MAPMEVLSANSLRGTTFPRVWNDPKMIDWLADCRTLTDALGTQPWKQDICAVPTVNEDPKTC